jgi:hypothetical protein
MDLFSSPLLSIVLGLAAVLLGLSLLVQVVQEIWKYLTSSRARCYTKVLEDFLGPWATRMTRPGILPEFQARGPFQFRRLGPTGVLLPLGKDDLVEGLERTAAPWHRRTLRALRTEVELQGGTPGDASSEWRRFLDDLEIADSGEVAPGDLKDVKAFLAEEALGSADAPPSTVDAPRALTAFRVRFMPQVVDAERHFRRLRELFDYRWRRRNLRQTFVFGFLVAFFAVQPVQELYDRARDMTPEDAVVLAERMTELYSQQQQVLGLDTATVRDTTLVTRERLEEALRQTVSAYREANVGAAAQFNGVAVFFDRPGFWSKVLYVVGCLLTAVLVSFGAPFWNDLVGTLLRFKQRPASGASPSPASQPSGGGSQ